MVKTYRVLDLLGLVTSGILGSLSTGADACVAVLGDVCETTISRWMGVE